MLQIRLYIFIIAVSCLWLLCLSSSYRFAAESCRIFLYHNIYNSKSQIDRHVWENTKKWNFDKEKNFVNILHEKDKIGHSGMKRIYIQGYKKRGPGYLSPYSDSLWTGRSGDRIPVGERFSALIQTGPGANQVSCTMGTRSFPGVKAVGAWR